MIAQKMLWRETLKTSCFKYQNWICLQLCVVWFIRLLYVDWENVGVALVIFKLEMRECACEWSRDRAVFVPHGCALFYSRGKIFKAIGTKMWIFRFLPSSVTPHYRDSTINFTLPIHTNLRVLLGDVIIIVVAFLHTTSHRLQLSH